MHELLTAPIQQTDVICSECNHTNSIPLRDVLGKRSVPCRFCRASIAVSAADTQARFTEELCMSSTFFRD